MNRITDYGKLATDISMWIKQYATDGNIKSLVVGVSGGIDSAVVSTLCAMTGLPTYCCIIDIHSDQQHIRLAKEHINSIRSRGTIVFEYNNLSSTFNNFIMDGAVSSSAHVRANIKSRLRMILLYSLAGSVDGIVVGTGNKVEDFGIGFFTKYGDGGVDISPIADLYKTEVRELAKYLGISQEIIDAAPTDGLWADDRTDEQQIGATYEELEWAMEMTEELDRENLAYYGTERENEVLKIYKDLNTRNQHKMQPIPIFKLNQ